MSASPGSSGQGSAAPTSCVPVTETLAQELGMQVTPQSWCLREGPRHREWCKGGERSCQPGGRFWQEWRCSLLRKQQEAAWPGHGTHCCEFRASVSQTGGFGVFTLLSEKPRTGPPCREVVDTLSGDAVGQPSGFACGVKSCAAAPAFLRRPGLPVQRQQAEGVSGSFCSKACPVSRGGVGGKAIKCRT